jgi:hypothetical protein
MEPRIDADECGSILHMKRLLSPVPARREEAFAMADRSAQIRGRSRRSRIRVHPRLTTKHGSVRGPRPGRG